MKQKPSVGYAWITSGVMAALSALFLFAVRMLIGQTKLIEVLHESIPFAIFALPMFVIILIPAVITILSFQNTTVGASGVPCLLVAEAVTFIAVLIWASDPKYFPDDGIIATSFYVFALGGAAILWYRSRETNEEEQSEVAKFDDVES